MVDFIELFNMVAKVSRPAHANDVGASSMDDALEAVGIDSLDGMVMMTYLCELYGIDDETGKEWRPATLQEVYDLLMAYKTTEPASVERALAQIK